LIKIFDLNHIRDWNHMSLVNHHQNSGFSLVEMLTVVILLGILSVVALGRLGNQDESLARGFYDDTVVAVGFAQKFAISSGCDVRVITTASSYQLRQSSACTADNFTVPVPNPTRRDTNYDSTSIPDGYTQTPGNITFNARGLREEGTSVFTVSGGPTVFSFRVYAGSGLVEKF
jgi:MSHA pilin protein MshC